MKTEEELVKEIAQLDTQKSLLSLELSNLRKEKYKDYILNNYLGKYVRLKQIIQGYEVEDENRYYIGSFTSTEHPMIWNFNGLLYLDNYVDIMKDYSVHCFDCKWEGISPRELNIIQDYIDNLNKALNI